MLFTKTPKPDNKLSNEEYKNWVEYRTQLINTSTDQINLFDKSTMALATGAFGISVLYLNKFNNTQIIVDIAYLKISWVFLLITILLNLSSYMLSWFENRKLANLITKKLLENNAEQINRNIEGHQLTIYLNFICLLTFTAGIILLAMFAVYNLESPENGKTTKPTSAVTSTNKTTKP